MRTTLTLDDDVAAMLARVRKAMRLGLKETVNEAMRRGLAEMARPEGPPLTPYRTPAVSLGSCLVAGIDDVAEALAVAEGESFR